MNQKGFVRVLVIIGIVIVAGIAGYSILDGQAFSPTPTPIPTQTLTPAQTIQSPNLLTTPLAGGNIVTNGYTYEFAYKQGPTGSVSNDHLVFVSESGEKTVVPDSVWFQIDAGSAVAKTGNPAGQDLTSFDMPVHPLNSDNIFLSTSEALDETFTQSRNRIYSYNLKTSELKEVYSEVAEGNSQMGTGSPNARILRTIGIDGSKLIVLYDDPDNSPGPCTRIWYHYKDLMGYLELADVQSGLRSYAVPTYKIEEDRLDADKCMNEL